MSLLGILNLSFNNFSGEVPKESLAGCFLLQILDLSNNKFSGHLLSSTFNFTKSTIIRSLKCAKCQIFGTFDTSNIKNRASWDVLYVLKIWNMLQYTFIFDTVRTEMPFRFIIILFVFLSHPIKIYHLSHSATPFLPHHLLFPTLFSSPICSFLLHTAIFLSPILPSTSFLPSLIYKNQVHRFFFSPFFRFLLSVLWSDI